MHLIGLVFNIAFVLHEFFALQYIANWFVFQLASKRISLFIPDTTSANLCIYKIIKLDNKLSRYDKYLLK